MKYMVPAFLCFALLAATLAAQTSPPVDWKTVTDLPALDASGLSAAERVSLLRILREEGCSCNCKMKIAECRVKDPGCGDSRTLASIAAQELRAKRSPQQVRAALRDSDLARTRRASLFGEPVKLSLEGAPSLGPANARITIVEFSDFQCPYCRVAAANVIAVARKFPNDVRLVFKQFPLEPASPAALAAQAALAAHAQGKFWELHDKIFSNPRAVSRAMLLGWGKEIGLDLRRFTTELDSGKYRRQVETEVREGSAAGVTGTPTFFINGRHYRGTIDPETVAPILEEELKKIPLKASL